MSFASAFLLASETGANEWAYVAAAYLVVFGALAVYLVRTVVLGRRAARRLPPEDRRWM